MKNYSCRAMLVLLLAITCISCQDDDTVSPYLSGEQVQKMVIGKWKIQKIDYQLCRSGSCNTTSYTGAIKDYFEFRSDSAFLVHKTETSAATRDAFRADYSLHNAFILTHNFWSARFDVKECNAKRMVLECSYIGSDPYAVFTDTYYLYR